MTVKLRGSGNVGIVDSLGAGVTFNCGSSEFGRILIAVIGWWDPNLNLGTLTGIDCGGIPLTQYSDNGIGSNHNEVWYLVSPPTGTQTTTATFSDIETFSLSAAAWLYADLDNPLTAAVIGNGVGTTPSITVPDWSYQDSLMDILTIVHGATVATRTAMGAGQVEIGSDPTLSFDAGTNYSGTASTVRGARSGDGTVSYSLSLSKTYRYQAVGVRHKQFGTILPRGHA